MIEVQHTLVHEDVVKENFVCNLNKCKGACCLEGDSGAPLAFRPRMNEHHAHPVPFEKIYSSSC